MTLKQTSEYSKIPVILNHRYEFKFARPNLNWKEFLDYGRLLKNINFLHFGFALNVGLKEYIKVQLPQIAVFAIIIALNVVARIFFKEHFWTVVAASTPVLIYCKVYSRYVRKSYYMNRVVWREKPFSYRCQPWREACYYLGGLILTVATAGLFFPFWRNILFARDIKNFSHPDFKIRYSGTTKEVFWEYFWAVPFTFATLGFYLPWFVARVNRYRMTHIWIGGDHDSNLITGSARGFYQVTGRDYLFLSYFNILALTFSLGLAWPWIKKFNIKFRLSHFSFVGNLRYEMLLAETPAATLPKPQIAEDQPGDEFEKPLSLAA
jgi:hypothetical protein